jgi:hypothetical protein
MTKSTNPTTAGRLFVQASNNRTSTTSSFPRLEQEQEK